MVVAHLMEPEGWPAEIVRGFPSALFAVLAGISLSIMGSRGVREGGAALAASRHGIIVRGAILIVLGEMITPFAGTINVVLTAFGICYIALACAPRWHTRTLMVVLAWTIILSAVCHVLDATVGVPSQALAGAYPAFAWASYMLIGVLAHRFIVGSARAQALTVAVGLPLAVAGAVARNTIDVVAAVSSDKLSVIVPMMLIDPVTHSGALIDLVTTAGGALAVVSLCLLAHRGTRTGWAGRLVLPLQAMGSMSLTVYVCHVLSAGPFLSDDAPLRMPVLGTATILFTLALATIIRLRFDHGPLEWALRRLVRTATDQNRPGRTIPEPT